MPTAPASTTADDTEIAEPGINITSHRLPSADQKTAIGPGSQIGLRHSFWALTSRDLYRLPALERGWDAGKYEEWLIQALRNALL